jgi:hypothetical protein
MVDNHFTWQYNPEDSSEHHTRRRENLKSHNFITDHTEPNTQLLCHGKECKLAFQPAWRISGLTSVPFPLLHSPVWRHGEGGKVEKIVRGSRGFFIYESHTLSLAVIGVR